MESTEITTSTKHTNNYPKIISNQTNYSIKFEIKEGNLVITSDNTSPEEVQKHKLRDIEPLHGDFIQVEFQTNFQRVLFRNYFDVLSNMDNKLTASCRMCKTILKSNAECGNIHRHLKVYNIDFYTHLRGINERFFL